jgi:DNA-binding transcriptional ArsR family regulator
MLDVRFGNDISSADEGVGRYRGSMAEFAREVVRTGGEVDFAEPAELIGHPARAAILLALLDGRALPMSMLAAEAGVGASTASAHLSRLVAGGLLQVRQEGRHRYYALASTKVAAALEALAQLAPVRPVRSLRAGTRAQALRVARTCYDHVAGHLGVAVMRSLLQRRALTGGDGLHHADGAARDRLAAPGHDVDYRLTDTGWQLFADLGVRVPPGRRRTVAYCVDWTEQRHHLAGAAGAALLTHFEDVGWLDRKHKRALAITDEGRAGFDRYFGIDTESFGASAAA